MRTALILAGLIFTATAPAAAQTLMVNEGFWRVSTDFYTEATVDGVSEPFDPDFQRYEECWEGEQMTSINEGMLTALGGECQVMDIHTNSYSLYGNLSCDIEGFDMLGSARFVKSSDGDSFSMMMSLAMDEQGVGLEVEAVMIAYNLGACPAP